jgi:hypothetical protein
VWFSFIVSAFYFFTKPYSRPGTPDPIPNAITTADRFLIASFLVTALVGFLAMYGKYQLVRYMRPMGGSMIERCRVRQRKRDPLEARPLHRVLERLLLVIQIALPLFLCGMILRVRSTSPAAAVVLTPIIAFGALLHLGVVMVVLTSELSPFAHLFHQPTSNFLRNLREKVWFEILATIVHPEPELS